MRDRSAAGTADRRSVAPATSLRRIDNRLPNFVDAQSRMGRNSDSRRIGQKRRRNQLGDFHFDQFQLLFVGQVALRDRDHAAPDAQQLQHGQVLARLRHHRIVGRDDQQRRVDARRAGHHRVNESLMARNVDQREPQAAVVEMRKPQLDRDPAALFLRQPIDRAARQRMHERRFAVIDMSGQANHELRTRHETGPVGSVHSC